MQTSLQIFTINFIPIDISWEELYSGKLSSKDHENGYLLPHRQAVYDRWPVTQENVVTNIPLIKCTRNNEKTVNLYDIEGVIYPPDGLPNERKMVWLTETKVYIKGGEYIGFLRQNGSFVVNKVRPGSHIIEVVCPNYVYDSVRVDVNTKGKFRARKINFIQSTQISPLPYPLKLKSAGPARYFQIREQWRLIDLFFNPMVLMMVLPLACIMLLPHVMNDPEAKKDMEQLQNLTKYDMPEVSEMITSFFSGGNEKQNCRTSKQNKKNKNSAEY